MGVTDRTKDDASRAVAAAPPDPSGDVEAQQATLAKAFDGVAELADGGSSDDAASAMTSAYFEAFEPIEKGLLARRPQEVPPLEARFNAIRGRIDGGLKGTALAAELVSLREEVAQAVARSQSGGAFGTAFFASLVTILREGMEVILLLTMLIALVAKAGQPKALRAIYTGVGAAAVASLLTAVALNLFVSTSQGRAREQIEGWVMMAAAGVLFYVSYWLISQAESKRWTEFLKGQIRRGVAAGGFGTLGLTAFLAVYREGAETALMYQSMIGLQGGSRAGLAGVAAGLAVGLVGLGAVYRLIRTTSVKLPLRTFFKVTGLVLFGMAIVFAGQGVFELQSARILKITPIDWLGSGVAWLGLYPNLQVLSVQGLLILGALVAVVMLLTDRGEPSPTRVGANAGAARERVPV
jgi:high-affinity iron transporter